jgi:hypothetical protein
LSRPLMAPNPWLGKIPTAAKVFPFCQSSLPASSRREKARRLPFEEEGGCLLLAQLSSKAFWPQNDLAGCLCFCPAVS